MIMTTPNLLFIFHRESAIAKTNTTSIANNIPTLHAKPLLKQ